MRRETVKPDSTPKPPKTLGRAGKRFWQSIAQSYDGLEAHHLALLQQACGCLDDIAAADEAIAKDGRFVRDRFDQVKEHPAIEIKSKMARLFRGHCREMGLNVDAPVDNFTRGARPPAVPQIRRA